MHGEEITDKNHNNNNNDNIYAQIAADYTTGEASSCILRMKDSPLSDFPSSSSSRASEQASEQPANGSSLLTCCAAGCYKHVQVDSEASRNVSFEMLSACLHLARRHRYHHHHHLHPTPEECANHLLAHATATTMQQMCKITFWKHSNQ